MACSPFSHPDPSPPPSPAPPPPTPPLPPRPRPLVLLPFPVAVRSPSEVSSSADDVADVKTTGGAKDADDEEDDEGSVDTTTRSLLDTVCTETGAWMLWDRSEQRRFRNATRWNLDRRGRGRERRGAGRSPYSANTRRRRLVTSASFAKGRLKGWGTSAPGFFHFTERSRGR